MVDVLCTMCWRGRNTCSGNAIGTFPIATVRLLKGTTLEFLNWLLWMLKPFGSSMSTHETNFKDFRTSIQS